MPDDPPPAQAPPTGSVPSLGRAHALLARALRAGFAAGAEATKEGPPGTRMGCEVRVTGDQATITDAYVKLPDGTRHGVRRRV